MAVLCMIDRSSYPTETAIIQAQKEKVTKANSYVLASMNSSQLIDGLTKLIYERTKFICQL